MINAIIFDFDGVIIESTHIKTEAFGKLFSSWPDKVDEIISYHLQNMGVSRYVKFRYFYENILKEPYTDEVGLELGNQFSKYVLDEVKLAPFVKGTKEFLEKFYQKYLFFIASGTPQDELTDIVSTKGLCKYFEGIFGAPAVKTEIIKNILRKYSLDKSEVVFIGDAETDRKAAESTGIHFILRVTSENNEFPFSCLHKIYDLEQLNKKIGEIK